VVCARLETIRTLVLFLVCFGRWLLFVTAASYTKPEECNTNEKKPEEASGNDETPHDHHQRSTL